MLALAVAVRHFVQVGLSELEAMSALAGPRLGADHGQPFRNNPGRKRYTGRITGELAIFRRCREIEDCGEAERHSGMAHEQSLTRLPLYYREYVRPCASQPLEERTA